MALSNLAYWTLREQAHWLQQAKIQQELSAAVKANHIQAQKQINEKLAIEWANYAGRNGYTMEEAQQTISQMDVKAFSEQAAAYVKEKNFSAEANERLQAYNLKMRVSRLELTKRKVMLELLSMGSREQSLIRNHMYEQAIRTATESAGILGSVAANPEAVARRIVNTSFHGADFSQRIWQNVDELRSQLDVEISRSVINGEHARDMAKRLDKRFEVGTANSERLAITEMARVSADSQLESFKANQIDKYEYRAEPTACKVCAALDGAIFSIQDMQIGVNMYPMHPYCHCYISPILQQ